MVAGEGGATNLAERPTGGSGDPTTARRSHATGAVDEGQVFLHYQPIYALATDDLIAFEALARREHPDDGLVVPDDRTMIATEDGTERTLGQWVMAEVCEQAGGAGVTEAPSGVHPHRRQAGQAAARRERGGRDGEGAAAGADAGHVPAAAVEGGGGRAHPADQLTVRLGEHATAGVHRGAVRAPGEASRGHRDQAAGTARRDRGGGGDPNRSGQLGGGQTT